MEPGTRFMDLFPKRNGYATPSRWRSLRCPDTAFQGHRGGALRSELDYCSPHRGSTTFQNQPGGARRARSNAKCRGVPQRRQAAGGDEGGGPGPLPLPPQRALQVPARGEAGAWLLTESRAKEKLAEVAGFV